MRRVLLDTNLYISFMNRGQHDSLVLGPGLVRHMSTVVLMELEVGASTLAAQRAVRGLARAFDKTGRLSAPSGAAWMRMGPTLRRLRSLGREIRRASLVNDVLIALTAREIGATLITNDDSDYAVIRKVVDFSFDAI